LSTFSVKGVREKMNNHLHDGGKTGSLKKKREGGTFLGTMREKKACSSVSLDGEGEVR